MRARQHGREPRLFDRRLARLDRGDPARVTIHGDDRMAARSEARGHDGPDVTEADHRDRAAHGVQALALESPGAPADATHARRLRMSTIVFQSYRTHDVPAWITRCLGSVRSWAAERGYVYEFIDDRLFDLLPPWYSAAVGHRLLPRTNLARLLAARSFLAQGHERVIWVDADVLVFDPASWSPREGEDGFAFTREMWFETRWGAPVARFGVNNAVFVLAAGNPFLDFCVWAHERIARTNTEIHDYATSTRLLTDLNRGAPLPLITSVGLVSAIVNRAIRETRLGELHAYMQAHGHAVQAANLSGSIVGREVTGIVLTPADQLGVIDVLLATRGDVLNDRLAGGITPASRAASGTPR